MRINYLARAAMLLLLAVLSSVGVWAETNAAGGGNINNATESGTVIIGEKSDSKGSSFLPSYPNNTYSMSQQIYTKDEIGKKGKITSIAFYNYDTGSERICDFYLTHTSKTSFDSNTDWVTVAESDKVFSGIVKFDQSKWTVVELDEPFEYDGKQNLLLTVDDNTGKDTGSNYNILSFNASGSHCLYYYKMFSTPVNLDPTQPIEESGAYYSTKNKIKLCFETNPKPYNVKALEVGDVSAQIQCSLREGTEKWNLRYRQAVAEGEQENEWTVVNNLTERSKTIEGLTAATKYEAQLRAVYAEGVLSDWTDPVTFVTYCCPVEQQAEIIYALNSYGGRNWFGFGAQIVDVTKEDNPVEVAFLRAPSYQAYSGTVTLCCGHKYKVNWIYDEENPEMNQYYSMSLYFEPGDKFFSMAQGGAPNENAELTEFVMDCGDYCSQSPQALTVDNTTYNSATISFRSETKAGEVVYSTEAGFDPGTATPTSVDYETLDVKENPWGGVPNNASLSLNGLDPLTKYYVRVRNVCTGGVGYSRWSDPVEVTTGSRYDAPTQVIAEPVNSHTEKLSWSSRGNEQSHNLYYRKQAAGNPVAPSAIQTFGGGKGAGFESGVGIQSSYGDHPFSNTLFVEGIPAGSSFSFKAGNGKTAGGPVKFLHGKRKKDKDKKALKTMESLDMSCLNDADRAARKKQYELLIWALEEQIKLAKEKLDEGTITQEQYDKQVAESTQKIDKYRENLEMLNALPTDAQKLETMKALEASLASEGLSQEERQSKLAELNELRAITTNAENPQKDGFSITKEKESANARTRGTGDDTYIFFIRHSDPNGVLLVKDLTITTPEQQGEWIVIPNVSGNSYMLAGLESGTTYEVMVEPVYDGGTTGSRSPITVFTTIGEETDPVEGEFSVSATKKVQFAKGNLRYEGDTEGYEAEWSMAKQQYEVLGEANIDAGAYESTPAYLKDLLCWSTTNNYYGVSNYYWRDDDVAAQYFQGDFVDWGENPALIADLGEGWSTLSKDEWTYLLTERENADKLQSFAIISYKEGEEDVSVKGLILLPDDWTGDEPAATYTAETWKTLEAAGAVFLPVTGHLWSYEDENGRTQTVINGIDVIGNYWTSTPAGDKSDYYAFAARFNLNDSELTPNAETERRLGCAIRLVKTITPKQELQDDWIIAIDDLDCTDSDQMPTLIVKDGETTLQEGVDYTVTYTNNKNVGTATATITFVEGSKYIGTASVTFNILRDMSNVFSTNNSWATYVAKEDLTTPDGLQAYTISAATASEVTATPIDYIPVGLAVLLNRADASVSAYKAKAYTETPAIVTSLLVGSAAETTSLTPYQDFILFNDEFVLSSAASVAAGHAYLPAAKVPAGARTMTIVIDGEATAINSMKITTADNDGWYTVDGRQLNRMPAAKGVYIHHGKKYVIK